MATACAAGATRRRAGVRAARLSVQGNEPDRRGVRRATSAASAWSRRARSVRAPSCAACCRRSCRSRSRGAGATELKTLIKAEWRGGVPLPAGRALLSAFYLNELVLKLLAREDPHPELWDAYEAAIAALAGESSRRGAGDRAAALRGPAARGARLRAAAHARGGRRASRSIRPHATITRSTTVRDGMRSEPGVRWPVVRGATLLALAEQRYPDSETAAEAKRLMRDVLDHYLESRRIESRRIAADLQALDERKRVERSSMIELGVNIDHVATRAPGAAHRASPIRCGAPSRRTSVAPTASPCTCARTGATSRTRTCAGCAS